ncbi:MAG: hypothetical protein R3E82_11745 [Pseudomonadales bacterium]
MNADDKQLFEKILELLAPDLFESLDIPEIDFDPSEFSTDGVADFLFAGPIKYKLSNWAVLSFLGDLTLPTTTDAQWRLGRLLANGLIKKTRETAKAGGRPSESLDRIFLCIFVEWCIERKEMGQTDTFERAKAVFALPDERLRLWYTAGKGFASMERMAGRIFLDVLDHIRKYAEDQAIQKKQIDLISQHFQPD